MRQQSDFDERELQFDIRRLESGDPVDVYLEREQQWLRGTFRVSTTGDAWVDVPHRGAVAFESALAMGLKRVLH